MKVHLIVDFSFIYYKYKVMAEYGRMSRLTADIDGKETDISLIYYCLKEVEKFRRDNEADDRDVTMSICFDMPTKRVEDSSDAASKYKANRVNRLTNEDFERLQIIYNILSNVGYNVYRFMGYEADDIVHHLVEKYSSQFDVTIIYTIDLDILANVKVEPRVAVNRFKARKGYTFIWKDTFSSYVSNELKCNMPFNGIVLFKCTAGDKSDQIDGIKNFGPKAFDKLVEYLNSKGIDWTTMDDWRNVEKTLDSLHSDGYFTDIQLGQAKESLNLVKPLEFDEGIVAEPKKKSSLEQRQMEYSLYGMKSLIK